MFDVYHHEHRSVTERVTQNVNVTEKRAPTDESVKLLREMEAEALKAIVKSTRVENTIVDAVLHRAEDMLNIETRFAIVYSIKGEKRRVDYTHRCVSWGEDEEIKAACGVRDALAKDIASVIAGGVFAAMSRQFSIGAAPHAA